MSSFQDIAMASASTSAADDWKFPLLLSFLAGASTCAGAAIVFIFDAKSIEKSMTFSLSLAASVMITVSVISIGPECLEDVITYSSLNHQVTMDLPLLGERLLSFGAGCFSYWLLSKALAAFPEPESLFFLQPQTNVKGVAEEADEERANLMISRSHSSDTYSPNKHTTSSPNKPSKASISQRNTPGVRRTNSRIRDELTDSDDDSQIHVLYEPKESKEDASSKRRSWRVAMLLFFSLMFHNFPEGLAVGKLKRTRNASPLPSGLVYSHFRFTCSHSRLCCRITSARSYGSYWDYDTQYSRRNCDCCSLHRCSTRFTLARVLACQ
jgi:zinc transporter ZupT